MTSKPRQQLEVAIACGGTGGHLFPGLAVAGQLAQHGAGVTLMVSPKEIDQLALKTAGEMKIVTLPAVGLVGRGYLRFLGGFMRSYRVASRAFASQQPHAVLAMGGFTSAPPILAGRLRKSCTFLHESNTIPGRANRWLSRWVERAFIGFPSAGERLHARQVSVTGTPVRTKFQHVAPGPCREALGLDPKRPLVLIMGGSQGAHGINELMMRSMPLLADRCAEWQWLHLAGGADANALGKAYAAAGLNARVHSFMAEMELAMGAATVAISRSGASSLAELAAVRLPSILIPFPAATDNHQFYNASTFEQSGAAKLLPQLSAEPCVLVDQLIELATNSVSRQKMEDALAAWHKPQAAEEIAQAILESVATRAQFKRASTRHATSAPRNPQDEHRRQLETCSATASTTKLPVGSMIS